MLRVLKALVRWCGVITVLVLTHSEDLTAHSRAKIKSLLTELKEAVKDYEKDKPE